MLVLRIGKDEDAVVTLPDGRSLTIRVNQVLRNSVRLGFDGPRDIQVDRRRIFELKKAEQPA